MEKVFNDLFGSSPRTTILGIIEGAFISCIPILLKSDFSMNKDWPYIIAAVIAVIRGRLSKDSNGISAQQGHDMQTVMQPKINALMAKTKVAIRKSETE